MSVSWARDSSNDWGCCDFFEFCENRKNGDVRMISPLDDGNKEGYSGNPTSYIDVDDPRISRYHRLEKESNRRRFVENIELVKSLISNGVVYPTRKMIENTVAEIRKIAGG